MIEPDFASKPKPKRKLGAKVLLRNLGLASVDTPNDGNCFVHCALRILQRLDSTAGKHANTTLRSLRAGMCDELLRNSEKYQEFVGDASAPAFKHYVEGMKEQTTYVDHAGIIALANLYPSELGRIVLLSTLSGKVVLHQSVMDSSDPVMVAMKADGISHSTVRAAMESGVSFMHFRPGTGKDEHGGHYESITLLPPSGVHHTASSSGRQHDEAGVQDRVRQGLRLGEPLGEVGDAQLYPVYFLVGTPGESAYALWDRVVDPILAHNQMRYRHTKDGRLSKKDQRF
jgi:hypothetical protein